MRQPTNENSNSNRNTRRAMAARLRREGFAAHEEDHSPLQQRIMEAIDAEPVPQFIAKNNPAASRRRATWLTAALSVAAVVAGLTGYVMGPAPQPPRLVREPAETTGDVFSAPAAALESLTELQARIDPLDELSHDAQLAGQMVLSTLPLSATGTD